MKGRRGRVVTSADNLGVGKYHYPKAVDEAC